MLSVNNDRYLGGNRQSKPGNLGLQSQTRMPLTGGETFTRDTKTTPTNNVSIELLITCQCRKSALTQTHTAHSFQDFTIPQG